MTFDLDLINHISIFKNIYLTHKYIKWLFSTQAILLYGPSMLNQGNMSIIHVLHVTNNYHDNYNQLY